MDRRKFLRMAGLAGMAVVGAACAPAAAPTPTPTKAPAAATTSPAGTSAPASLKPEQIQAQLYEAAKKEGQVLVYATGTTKDMDDYRKVFTKTYPGIEIKEYMGTGEQIIEKMTTELKAGKVNDDFFAVPLEQWVQVLENGLAEKYDFPEKGQFPADAVDPNGFYVVEFAVLHVMSYNTQMVPAAEAPKSYDDLLKPFFKGKVGLEPQCYSWFSQQIKIAGKDKVTEWAKKFSAQQPKFIKGHTTIADAVVSGEVAAAVTVYQHRVEQQKDKSAPVEWVAVQPVSCDPVAVGIAKGAPHPNAAKLFANWRISPEGQKVTYEVQQRYPFRKGIDLPKQLQIKVAVPSLETARSAQESAKLFKEIFGLI